jgi:hypothetical protein
MINTIIHTLRQIFADPDELYLSQATDLADLERRMKRIETKSLRSR